MTTAAFAHADWCVEHETFVDGADDDPAGFRESCKGPRLAVIDMDGTPIEVGVTRDLRHGYAKGDLNGVLPAVVALGGGFRFLPGQARGLATALLNAADAADAAEG